MKQQINLYQIGLRKTPQPFSAGRLLQTLVAALVLAIAATALIRWSEHRQAQLLAELKQQRSQQQDEIVRLEAQFPPPQEDPALRAALTRQEQELSAKQRFLAEFSDDALGNPTGFAQAMSALAGRPMSGRWLRSFSFQGDGRLAFSGSASEAQAVPAFVARLGEDPVFAGREFETLRIERSQQNPRYLNFSLRSRERTP